MPQICCRTQTPPVLEPKGLGRWSCDVRPARATQPSHGPDGCSGHSGRFLLAEASVHVAWLLRRHIRRNDRPGRI
ncbi:hypothetical protein XEUV329_21625, partial [Xanthomonas euvesicatoria]